MVTVDEYIRYFNKFKCEAMFSGNYASEPRFLFNVDGTFNDSNWCGCDILRRYVIKCYDGDIVDERVTVKFKDDTWEATIKLKNTVVLKWYKSRGKTDIIIVGGKKIKLEQYVDILRELNIDLK